MSDLKAPIGNSGKDLQVLAEWEDHVGWIFDRTSRWPKNCRHSLGLRVENLALDILDDLIVARYCRGERHERLQDANLGLERLRFLLRLAHRRSHLATKSLEFGIRQIGQTGRMIHGWRQSHAHGITR